MRLSKWSCRVDYFFSQTLTSINLFFYQSVLQRRSKVGEILLKEIHAAGEPSLFASITLSSSRRDSFLQTNFKTQCLKLQHPFTYYIIRSQTQSFHNISCGIKMCTPHRKIRTQCNVESKINSLVQKLHFTHLILLENLS